MDDPRSYRPISLLCVPYKLLERLLLFRLEPVVDPQLPTLQGAFRRGRSTVQQVVKLTSDIEESYEGKRKSGLVLVDLTATNDTVWHQRLALKLLQTIPDRHLVRVIVDIIPNRRFILKTSDGNAAASDVWRTECLRGQRLHLCCLTSRAVTSPTPWQPNMTMLMTGPSCFPKSVGMRWKKSFLWICKELLSAYLHGGSGWAQPKLHALRSTWIIGNPAVGLRSPSTVPPSPASKLQLTLESHLIASSPSSNASKVSVAKSEPVIACCVSWLAQHGVPTPLFCELQLWAWSTVPRNTPPQLGAAAPTRKS